MDYRNTLTTCTYCGCGCNLFLESLDGRLTGTIPCKTSPVNEGKLCIKGWNVHQFVQSEKRLKKPLLRKNGELVEVSWDEALDFVASGLKSAKASGGSDSIGFFASAKVTNEENFLMQKFARAGVGTNNVDHCARLWHSSTVAGLAASFGSGAMTNAVSEIEDADAIFIIGSNTATSHPLVATRIFRAHEKGAKILVADPRKNQIAAFASLYVRHKPGTDVALLNGMMKVILDKGLEDKTFISENTEEFDAFKTLINGVSLEEVSRITGVSTEDIHTLAETYAKAGKASIVYCMGITQHTNGVNNVKSLANLSMLTGNIGKYGTGVNPLRGQNNVQGACDMGGLPNVYTGYQAVTLGAANKKFAEAWGVSDLSSKIGLTIPEMLHGIEKGEVKALWIMGENPVVSDPDANHVVKALEKVELLIVQDIFLTPTARLAHVVLPGVSFAEKDGTFSNTERRVTRVRKAVDPVGESRQDWQIIQDISNRFGFVMAYESPEAIFKEIAGLTPSYGGITYERLEGPGLQWPCPSLEHPGTPFLHKDGKFTRGKGLFHAIAYKPPAEIVDDDFPFWMTTGRIYAHYHTGTMTRNSRSLDLEAPEGFLEINPVDAKDLEILDGQKIKMTSRRGEIETRIMITERVEKGVVFMPFHFEESNVNKLTNPAYDPIAKIPEFKVCAVKLEKVS